MKSILLGTIFSMGLLGWAHPALACSCVEQGPIAKEFAEKDYVFSAEVISRLEDRVGKDQFNFRYVYELRVIKSYKGNVGTALRVTSASNDGMCGYVMEAGEKHLIWTYKAKEGGQLPMIGVTLCTRSKPLAQAAEDLRWLEKNAP